MRFSGTVQSQPGGAWCRISNSLAETIDRLILTMYPNHRNSKKSSGGNGQSDRTPSEINLDKKSRVFRGLAMSNHGPWQGDDYLDGSEKKNDSGRGKDAIEDTLAALEQLEQKKMITHFDPPASKKADVDDTLALLERLAPRQFKGSRTGEALRKRSISPNEDHERSKRRQRRRSRSASPNKRSSRRPGRQGDNDDLDEFGRNGRNGLGQGYGNGKAIDEFRKPPPPEIDDVPVLFKIYNGKIRAYKILVPSLASSESKAKAPNVMQSGWFMFLPFVKDRE
jgi:ATP-dependent RNA helicase DHX8/PRP22